MADYDLNLVYCSETEVFAVGRYTWDANSRPTDTEVYGFARQAKAFVHNRTRKAGADTPPPVSAIADDSIAQELVAANATGAAYFAWRAAATTGDKYAIEMRDQLREDWIQYVGGMNAAGHQIDGTIVTTLQAVNNVLVMHGDEIDGHSAFPSSESTETLGRQFTAADVD